jgi:hypothetical protein
MEENRGIPKITRVFFFLFKVRYFTFLVSCLNYKKEEQGEQEGNRRVVFSLRKLGEQAGDEIA